MKIITLIPFYRETRELTAACLDNVASYADGAAICVNDFYDARTDAFLRSFPIVKSIAYVAKDGAFYEPLYLSSLVTMAQALQADWIVRQDVDEVFEPRVSLVRDVLAKTRFDVLFALWPNCVSDERHHFYSHDASEVGLLKPVFYKFDLPRVAVPTHPVHCEIKLHQPAPAVMDVRMRHKTWLKSDQEMYVDYVEGGKLALGEITAQAFAEQVSDAFEAGKDKSEPTFLKRQRETSLFLPRAFEEREPVANLPITLIDRTLFTRNDLGDYLERLYPGQDARARLARETTAMSPLTSARRSMVSAVKRSPWLRRLRDRRPRPGTSGENPTQK